MHKMNLAFMAKKGWRLLTHQDKLWAKVLMSKYIKGMVSPENVVKKRRACNAWQGVVAAKALINLVLKSRI